VTQDFLALLPVITSHRPEKRNVLDDRLVVEALAVIRAAEREGRCVGIIHAERAVLCAGADRGGVGDGAKNASLRIQSQILQSHPVLDLIERIRVSRVYWIAAIQGRPLDLGGRLSALRELH
jgi:enoyl-CoA hydratase/carnithine racemase